MIAIIDYRAGNLTSVKLAFDALNVETVVTSDPGVIRSCARVVFPGVGAAGSAMRNLADINLITVLREVIAAGTPFLGICVGTQVLFDFSEEDGGTAALGLLPGRVRLFSPADSHDKVPHMGWNQVQQAESHPLWDGIEDGARFYFVHSYYVEPQSPGVIAGSTHYGIPFTSAIARANIFAVQFHPEKSAQAGLRLLGNFMRWNP